MGRIHLLGSARTRLLKDIFGFSEKEPIVDVEHLHRVLLSRVLLRFLEEKDKAMLAEPDVRDVLSRALNSFARDLVQEEVLLLIGSALP